MLISTLVHSNSVAMYIVITVKVGYSMNAIELNVYSYTLCERGHLLMTSVQVALISPGTGR